jgi:hypothetical protein
MNQRSRQAVVWTAIIIAAGLVVRRAPLHLPEVATKFGGSILWAAMVYAILVAIFPIRRPLEIAVAAALLALAVELFKLVHTPALDAFRLTLAGQLLLGRIFSYVDILAYWATIIACAALDNSHRKRNDHSRGRQPDVAD